ncbi:MAG: hypothetical protein EB072_04045 [Betaproteobacteria bacterium]|nr:hypothetical protein [Betaproteobacteria bacterium]
MAHVQPVVQDARAFVRVAVDSGLLPLAAAWGRNGAGVEFAGYGAGRPSIGVPLENLDDDVRLGFVHFAAHRVDDGPTVGVKAARVFDGDVPVTVAAPARVVAGEGLTVQPPVGLFAEVVEINLVH